MNPEIIEGIALGGSVAFLILLAVWIGYLMGRKSLLPPKEETPVPKFKKGDGSEPEGDLFNDAMKSPEEKRVATTKGKK